MSNLDFACLELKQALKNKEAVKRYEQSRSQSHPGWSRKKVGGKKNAC